MNMTSSSPAAAAELLDEDDDDFPVKSCERRKEKTELNKFNLCDTTKHFLLSSPKQQTALFLA